MSKWEKNWAKMRDKVSVIADILEIARKETTKTHIQYNANLCFKQLNEYLTFLLEIDLLEETVQNEKKLFKVTEKGQSFLARSYELRELLETDEAHEKGFRRPPLQLLKNTY